MTQPPVQFDARSALIFAALLMGLGLLGLLRRRNMLFLLMSLELVFVAAVTAFVALAHQVRTYNGQVFAVFIIMVTAAQAAVGVAIVVSLYRHRHSIDTQHWRTMRG